VEESFGDVPSEVDLPWWRELGRSLVDSLRLMLISAVIGIPLFLAGFIPIVGQTVIPVLGALVGGWFLAVELVGIAFARRGLGMRDRLRALRGRRWTAVGFGACVFLCFLIPLGCGVHHARRGGRRHDPGPPGPRRLTRRFSGRSRISM